MYAPLLANPLCASLAVTVKVTLLLVILLVVILTSGADASFFTVSVFAPDLFPALSYVYAVIVLVPSAVILIVPPLVIVVSPFICEPLIVYVVLFTPL